MPKDLTMERAMRTEKLFPNLTLNHASLKLAFVADEFGLTQTRYFQQLNAWLDDPRFIALDPAFARILRERRAAGARSVAVRRSA